MRNFLDHFLVRECALSTEAPFAFDEEYPSIQTEIEVTLFSPDGTVFEVIDLGRNTITNQGRSNMAHLFSGDDVANRSVTTIKFGDAGHNPSDPTQALTTSSADTGLFGSTISTKAVTYDFPDGTSANKVSFLCTLAANEANGSGAQALSEVGLYDLQGRMLAHKTFGLITKSSAFGLSIRYSFIF